MKEVLTLLLIEIELNFLLNLILHLQEGKVIAGKGEIGMLNLAAEKKLRKKRMHLRSQTNINLSFWRICRMSYGRL